MFKKSNNQIIPGIDQFCDRWCEKCAFTSRCVVFVRSGGKVIADREQHNASFWQQLSNQLADTCTLLQKVAEERGISLAPPTAEEVKGMREASKREERIREKHPLVILSLEYLRLADQLLDEKDWLQVKTDAWQQELSLGIRNAVTVSEEAAALKDCLDVVQWYFMQINLKLARAVAVFDRTISIDPFLKKDANGSAKVALIGIERSMAAWQSILQMIPEAEDAIIELLAILQRLRQMVQNYFPKASAFKRPGFDD